MSVLKRREELDHPAIAKVFDAGTTPQGQPYFVMEYVPGVPLTEYCDQKKLEIKDRLELFIQACEGVQLAHQKAIIHRDLKPANILVAEVDGKPIAEQLQTQSLRAQRLAISISGMGKAYGKLGDVQRSCAAYTESLKLYRGVLKPSPEDARLAEATEKAYFRCPDANR